MDFKNLKKKIREPTLETWPNVYDFLTKIYTLGYGFKNL
jgi:hypothetical protein